MSEAYCLWHDKELKDVTEWQQNQCNDEGMKCDNCNFLTTKEEQALKKLEGEKCHGCMDGGNKR